MIFFLENSLNQTIWDGANFELVLWTCLNLSTISMQNVKKETENSFRHLLNETWKKKLIKINSGNF